MISASINGTANYALGEAMRGEPNRRPEEVATPLPGCMGGAGVGLGDRVDELLQAAGQQAVRRVSREEPCPTTPLK